MPSRTPRPTLPPARPNQDRDRISDTRAIRRRRTTPRRSRRHPRLLPPTVFLVPYAFGDLRLPPFLCQRRGLGRDDCRAAIDHPGQNLRSKVFTLFYSSTTNPVIQTPLNYLFIILIGCFHVHNFTLNRSTSVTAIPLP